MGVNALDDALTVFAATAPEYGPLGLSNHGPMAAEALAGLGRPDAIEPWVRRYRDRLAEAPPPADPPRSTKQVHQDAPALVPPTYPIPRRR